MARYTYIDTNPRFLAVDRARQLVPGTCEHALNQLLDHEIDVSHVDACFRNDETGATAYPPAMLPTGVLFADSRGIVSSRESERACREHVTCIALCGDTAPHVTTSARCVSTRSEDIAHALAAVVAIGDSQGVIGREMFAIDGVTLPSNASKHRSGTRAECERHAAKLEAAAATMLERHREADALPVEPDLAAEAAKRIERLERDAAQMSEWLAANPEERRDAKGASRTRMRTDNENAKMATGKGVMQGYTGVAAVDARHQIIVEAQAHGTGSEQELLMSVMTAITDLLAGQSLITADAGSHSEANLQQLAAMDVTALIADNAMRRRDGRFVTQDRHKDAPDPLYDKSRPKPEQQSAHYQPSDCRYDADARTCACPAGKVLNRNGRHSVVRDESWERFHGKQGDCVSCAHAASARCRPAPCAPSRSSTARPRRDR